MKLDGRNEPELVWGFFGRRKAGFFVEVGANDPVVRSQTWLLEQNGWRGILVEPLSCLHERLCAQRPHSRVVRAACSAPGHPPTADFYEAEHHAQSGLKPDAMQRTQYVRKEVVPVFTLDEILDQAGNPQLDFVSIDVEGLQLEVMSGFDLARHRPALLLIEDSFLDWRTHLYMRGQHYRLARRSGGLNSWYVPREHPFRAPVTERLKLFRYVWLGTPFRRLKHWWRSRRSPLPSEPH